MKNIIGNKSNLCISLLIYALLTIGCNTSLYSQKLNDSLAAIYLADPTIFYDGTKFYLYGTVERNTGKGFKGYESNDLKTWKMDTAYDNGYALKKGTTFGTANFWAPQVFKDKGIFYMAYVADENIAIASANNPAGPFTQKTIRPLQASQKQIDPFIFIDNDGKKYLYHVRLDHGNRIFVAQMKDDLSDILPNTLKDCITASLPWENTAGAAWPVTEGPSVLKHKNIYYLFYTANDFRNPDYAVGYATSNSPLGPWKKYAGNPIISRENIGVNGTGHGDFFSDAQNKLWYVFHTHFSDNVVTPRKTALIQVKFVADPLCPGIDKMLVEKNSFKFLTTEQN